MNIWKEINLWAILNGDEELPKCDVFGYLKKDHPDGPEAGMRFANVGTLNTRDEASVMFNAAHGIADMYNPTGNRAFAVEKHVGFVVKRTIVEIMLDAVGEEALGDIIREAAYFSDDKISSEVLEKHADVLGDLLKHT